MIRDFSSWLRFFPLIVLPFSQAENVSAQDETATTTQYWFFWNHNHSFTPRFKYIGDIGYKQELPYHKG